MTVRTSETSPSRLWRLFVHQFGYEFRATVRNPVLIGFTLAMPLTLLVIFGQLLGGLKMGPWDMTYRQYLVPNVMVLSLVASCFAGLGGTVATRRAAGELKRLRGTPLPAPIAIAAMILTTTILGILASVLVLIGGWLVLGVEPPNALDVVPVIVVGASSFTALGLAIASMIRRSENAAPVTNMVVWPVCFISGTFTWVSPDSVLGRIAALLPVQHLNDAALRSTSVGHELVEASTPKALLISVAWGIGGAVFASARLSSDFGVRRHRGRTFGRFSRSGSVTSGASSG